MKFRRLTALVAAMPLLFTGCAVAPAEPSAAASAAVSPALAPYYSQKLTWKTCGELKCATIKVPLNWNKPSATSIKLALNYLPSTGNADRGWLIENPGGPGGSGIDFVEGGGEQVASANLRKHYNVLGFDPRGVQHSSKITCLNAKQTDEFLYEPTAGALGSAEELKSTRDAMKKYIDACKKNSGALLGYVDTVSAARDMDIIRALLKQSKLNYLGFSYGTFLGATYAALYPKNVGRMVLDGAIDPSVSDEDQSANQLQAFDTALKNYLKDCLATASTCPFSGTVDTAMAKITAFYRQLETSSLTTTLPGRRLKLPGAITGLIMTLYSNDYWKYTSAAFRTAFQGDGTLFLQLADFYNDRNEDGTYNSNTLEANMAVNCLDSRSNPNPAAMAKQNARLLELSSFFGRYWQNGAIGCEQWPYPLAKKPASYSAVGSGPILVVGTTGDPATPYWQAQNLANKIFANGHLVTFNGEGHTAYGRSNACIVKAVDGYLIDGTVPATDPNC